MNYTYTILSYIFEVDEIPDKQEFVKTIKFGLSKVNEDNIMTLAEQFRQEGRQEGIQEGLQKGKIEASNAVKAIAMNLFSQGLPTEQIVAATGLGVEEIRALKNKLSS